MKLLKTIGKQKLCVILEWQVRRLRRKNQFTLIAVAGSIGKTSTKTAIATALQVSRRVRYQAGNYNDRLTVPLVFFGQTEPGIFNVLAWMKLLLANERQLHRPYPYDTVVVELGPDGPGQMRHFAYLNPDLSVLTAITPEHMEFFGTMEVVAEEELQVFNYSQKVLVNSDLVAAAWLAGKSAITYGTTPTATYQLVSRQAVSVAPQRLQLRAGGSNVEANIAIIAIIGAQGASIGLAVFAVGNELGLTPQVAAELLPHIQAVPGRMQILKGIRDSTLIDDTYNASPVSVIAALDSLYALEAPQRIAVLGGMNELGATSQEAHQQVGAYCDPAKLELIITVGADAQRFLAPAAHDRGCRVESFDSPYAAGKRLQEVMKPGAVVLAKGSQNLIYTEETLKFVLGDPADSHKLVRQSGYWLRRKASQFADAPKPS